MTKQTLGLVLSLFVFACFKDSNVGADGNGDDHGEDTDGSSSHATDDENSATGSGSNTEGGVTTDSSASDDSVGSGPTGGDTMDDGTTGATDSTVGVTDSTATSTEAEVSTSLSTEDTNGDTGETSGTSGATPVCGDAIIQEGEGCDDGTNAGSELGDCAPDCSKVVVQRLIRLSATASVTGDMDGDIITTGDAACGANYKAMVVSGLIRIASINAFAGDGQKDWVLQPWTRYVNNDAELVWRTDGTALLGVTEGAWSDLLAPVTKTENLYVWTGLANDWTTFTSTDLCGGWMNTGVTTGPFARGWHTDQAFLHYGPGTGVCNVGRYFYCVEQ